MKLENLKIGEIYFIEGLGEGVYMGRLNMDIFLKEDRRKGKRLFRLLRLKGSGLIVLTKKEVENDIK